MSPLVIANAFVWGFGIGAYLLTDNLGIEFGLGFLLCYIPLQIGFWLERGYWFGD